MEIPKEYNAKEIESELLEKWDPSIYYFDWNSEKPQYIIDTPPPYPTGDFHIGNALNWCYIDFIARYKRMRGYNVMFPQGWDCHGLPTEVKVEEIYNITKNQVPRTEFRKYCEELTAKNIKKMKKTLKRLGFSTDWSNEYITMDPEYYGKTQISFIKMYNSGRIYREDHPVNWCPRCETAIAYAEVEYSDRETTLNYLLFNSKLKIATTRPELLAACVAVAVNPMDERYKDYIGKEVQVPIFNHKVKIFADAEVDPEFGTGVVMICTFGDKQDVRWWKEHNLPLRKAIDRNGKMTSIANKYEGMSVEECKNAIIEDLKNNGILYKQEKIDQSVGLCWRCKTPIEILSERQWFVKIDPDKIMQISQEIEWIPPHFEIRLKNWT
ncbi:MAG: class I tRNA ligase family protein, partial [Methanosarcinales archaeon]